MASVKTKDNIKEELGITSSTTLAELIALALKNEVISLTEINKIKSVSVLSLGDSYKNQSEMLKSKFTDMVIDGDRGQTHAINIRNLLLVEIVNKLNEELKTKITNSGTGGNVDAILNNLKAEVIKLGNTSILELFHPLNGSSDKDFVANKIKANTIVKNDSGTELDVATEAFVNTIKTALENTITGLQTQIIKKADKAGSSAADFNVRDLKAVRDIYVGGENINTKYHKKGGDKTQDFDANYIVANGFYIGSSVTKNGLVTNQTLTSTDETRKGYIDEKIALLQSAIDTINSTLSSNITDFDTLQEVATWINNNMNSDSSKTLITLINELATRLNGIDTYHNTIGISPSILKMSNMYKVISEAQNLYYATVTENADGTNSLSLQPFTIAYNNDENNAVEELKQSIIDQVNNGFHRIRDKFTIESETYGDDTSYYLSYTYPKKNGTQMYSVCPDTTVVFKFGNSSSIVVKVGIIEDAEAYYFKSSSVGSFVQPTILDIDSGYSTSDSNGKLMFPIFEQDFEESDWEIITNESVSREIEYTPTSAIIELWH